MIQTKDSCVFISFKYTGNGALYVLNRIANTQVPDALNIVNEGVYLGVYALSVTLLTLLAIRMRTSPPPSAASTRTSSTRSTSQPWRTVAFTFPRPIPSLRIVPLFPRFHRSLRSRSEVERREQLHLGGSESCESPRSLIYRRKCEPRRAVSTVWARYPRERFRM